MMLQNAKLGSWFFAFAGRQFSRFLFSIARPFSNSSALSLVLSGVCRFEVAFHVCPVFFQTFPDFCALVCFF
jgi:hypothetical protein